MNRNNSFLQKQYRKALWPIIISSLAGTANTLIDSLFVSRCLGPHALAAVNLSLPVVLLMCTVGCLLSDGAFFSSTICLGEKNVEGARKKYHCGLALSLIFGVIFLAAGLLGAGQITSLFAADDLLVPVASKYVGIVLMGGIFSILVYFPSCYLQADGKSKDIAVMMVLLIVADVVLDYIFMYPLDMGIAGAAWATVLSLMIGCIYGFVRLQDKQGKFYFDISKMNLQDVGSMLVMGTPAALATLMDALRMLILNMIIYSAGGALALASWAVINVFAELSLSFVGGIPTAGAPLAGIYYTTHDNEGVRILVTYEMKMAFIMSLCYSVFIVIQSRPIADFYRLNGDMQFPLICLGVSILFNCLCSIMGSYFNVTKRLLISNLIVFFRTFLMPVLTAVILANLSVSIWLFLPVGAIASFVLMVVLTCMRSRFSKGRGHDLSWLLLLDDYLIRTNKYKSISLTSTDSDICRVSEEIMEFCGENEMEKKLVNRMGLAFEEVMTVMAKKAVKPEEALMDVRIYADEGRIGISVMCSGTFFNPFQEAMTSDDELSIMGVKMIEKFARECRYLYVLGMNIIEVEF